MTAQVMRGTPASPGAAIGPAWTRSETVAAAGAGPPEAEAQRARRGLELAADELGELARTLTREGHAGDAEIVEANQLMAQDPTLLEAAANEALAGATAPEAIARAIEPHAQALAALDDPLLAARAADLHAIARRAGDLSTGTSSEPPAGSVVIADDLGPGEVAAWSANLAAIVLAGGGTTAHAAIVARSLGIPLVTGAGPGVLGVDVGDEVGVDADRGHGVAPARHLDAHAPARAGRAPGRAGRARPPRSGAGRPRTGDGRTIRLLANAGTAAEVMAALDAGAEGIGLLRSELSFLEARAWPTEEEHARVLQPMLEPLGHRIATVRTLDFGGDKTPPFLAEQAAGGPLGPRGIRLALAADAGVAPAAAGALPGLRRRGRAGAGADGDRRGRDRRRAHDRPRRPRRRRPRRARSAGRGHDRGAGRGADGKDDRRPLRLPLDRHERPHPVHAGRRPPEPRHRRDGRATTPPWCA